MKIFTRSFIVSAAIVAMASAGCTLESPDVPPLTGPSGFALALDIRATPDIVVQDGVQSSVIKITARDQNGQPVPNLSLRVDTLINGATVDFGTLSARNVTTNGSGDATVVYTPPKAAIPGFDSGTIVQIQVQPVGTNFGSTIPRMVQIRLVPESVAQMPGAPTPSFTFTPSNPKPGDLITYNGSGSSDADGTIVRYHWTFSDGHPENDEPIVSHDFTSAGSYFVTLTVTDNEGKNASVTRTVIVSGS